MNDVACLIANHLAVSVELPCNITERVVLRRPLEDELTSLRGILPAAFSVVGGIPPYEWKLTKEGNGHTGTRDLDPAGWKYWMLCDQESGAAVREIEAVARLLNPGIEVAITLWRNGLPEDKRLMGRGFAGSHIMDRYWSPARSLKLPDPFDSGHIDQLRKLYVARNALSDQFAFIKEALENFNALAKVDDDSNLKIIGYFSVIESLITHQPRLAETLDSISHQLRGKLILLSKRFELQLDTGNYFDAVSQENLWKKLYGFRSGIAHGQRPLFAGDYAVLKDIHAVSGFLENVCKQLLIYSLNEPDLVNDLRAC